MKEHNPYSGMEIEHVMSIAVAICLLKVAGAYFYAYLFLDKAASQTFIVGIPCLIVSVALVIEVIVFYKVLRK